MNYDWLEKQIANAYSVSGNNIGWRFLDTKKSVLENNNGVMILVLNPGGDIEPQNEIHFSCENGSPYLVESWDGYPKGAAPFQIQMKGLATAIASIIGSDMESVINDSIIGSFVPFRSASFPELLNKKNAINLAKNIWGSIIFNCRPRVIICIAREILKAIQETENMKVISTRKYSLNWGDLSAECYKMHGEYLFNVVWFPHLSRFKIMNRQQSKEGIINVLRDALK